MTSAGHDARQEWLDVDQYFHSALVRENEALVASRASSADTLYPGIDVAPNMGAFLALLIQISGAKRVLEVGTLAGYSTIWMAQATGSAGRLITCEIAETNAKVARKNFAAAGVADQIEIMLGDAAESLQALIDDSVDPFDMVFIDADKRSNPTYLARTLQLSRSGTVIVIDNTVRGGAVIDQTSEAPETVGTRRLVEMIADDDRLFATAIQTVGSKGWDGFTIVRVR